MGISTREHHHDDVSPDYSRRAFLRLLARVVGSVGGLVAVPPFARAGLLLKESPLPFIPFIVKLTESNFALKVVSQPFDNPGYISSGKNEVTRFSYPEEDGRFGFLAHVTLTGQLFQLLQVGEHLAIQDIFGRIYRYCVEEILRYEAIRDNDPTTSFYAVNQRLERTSRNEEPAADVYSRVYEGPSDFATFQTCITHENSSTWGRFFAITRPIGILSPISRTRQI